jgi:Patatin-like phospholipase
MSPADTDESAKLEGDQVHVFDAYLQKERVALNLPCAPADLALPCGSALAISGGGIRSASFALGVIQTFLNERPNDAAPKSADSCFDRFDYMSTVSGGGYIGGAVSWLKFHFRKDGAYRRFLGAADLGARSAEFLASKTEHAQGSRFTWLDYFRQHGNYLKPSSMSTMSLIGVALRGTLITLCVYTAILAALLWSMEVGGILPPSHDAPDWAGHPQRIESWLLFLGLIVSGAFLLFGVASWLGSIPTRAAVFIGAIPPVVFLIAAVRLLRHPDGSFALNPDGLYWRWPVGAGFLIAAAACLVLLWWARSDYEQARDGTHVVHKWQYRVRIIYQEVLGPLLTGLTLLAAIWSVPHAFHFIFVKLGGTFSAGLSSSLLGVIGAIYQFIAGRDKKSTSSMFSTVRILVTAVLLVYGILLVAYSVVQSFHDESVEIAHVPFSMMAVVGVVGVLAGFIVNANYIGIGRMYRDRLMELFMPDVEAIRDNQWKRAGAADQFDLVKLVDETGGPQRPLHLVNCNVVMVGALQDRFRGRGGDSFFLSPCFCGSSATGWIDTRSLGDGHFTLATAVAASGAAASPHAGVAGRGITRNALVSLLLSLTNVRLGYWVRNPRASHVPRAWHKWFPPNLLAPGIRQGLFGSGTTENAFFIELTDGGHFDNTGIYELVRRRVKVIVLSQASQDVAYAMEDLANTIQRVRVDFGVHIRFNNESYPLELLRPAQLGAVAKRGWAVGTIKYPGTDSLGIILYLQASPVAGMNADTVSYWRRNVDFPNQTTADQFFDEEQLEAYRELGMAIAQEAIATLKALREPRDEPMVALRKTFGW